MKVQSVLFKKDVYDRNKAKKWLAKHNLKPIKKVHETNKYLRYRIRDPQKFQKFRIMQVRKNIKFVMGLK